ncbi:hypothetical protein BDA96_01G276300 [Sorghum bicolor]|jgi:hypothetical protein|uniref:Uncharacterized protein n=2 Tax=Sorghum bicolor TaxID=4558 RepID=A0A921UYN5_SORBI|nr:hypothetical protein BDA96_01G276300 [Sorghum bicolor]KXG38642.1 hypothetical protein SORBI_3001G260900 [Sorghum bicolor]
MRRTLRSREEPTYLVGATTDVVLVSSGESKEVAERWKEGSASGRGSKHNASVASILESSSECITSVSGESSGELQPVYVEADGNDEVLVTFALV